LAERFALTGMDISTRQIELARRNVPGATFIHGDMTRVRFPPASFDGVAAFYALTHLPHGELPGLLKSIGKWLRPGGLLVASMGAGLDQGTVERDWLGAPMYFSGYPVEDSLCFVEQAGLQMTTAKVEIIYEKGAPKSFLWVVARKPEAPS